MRILPVDRFPPEDRLELEGPEAHHLIRVLRVRRGESFVVQDAGGARRAAVVAELHGARVGLLLGEALAPFPAKAAPLWVAAALPKGKLLAQMMRGCTEAGWDRFFPTHFARSVRVLEAEASTERLQRTIREAVKQCGVPPAQTVEAPREAADLPAPPAVERIVFATTGAAPPWTELAPTLSRDRPWLLVLGPEGGFEAAELEALAAPPTHTASLGPQVLRLETAAVVATAIAALELWRPR